jgi:hypothetical protein
MFVPAFAIYARGTRQQHQGATSYEVGMKRMPACYGSVGNSIKDPPLTRGGYETNASSLLLCRQQHQGTHL